MLDTSHLPRVPEWKKAGDFEDILYEKSEEGIAKITINRPQVRNAFRPLTVREMETALADARDDENIGVIILTGQGKDAFCSGGDQKVRGNGRLCRRRRRSASERFGFPASDQNLPETRHCNGCRMVCRRRSCSSHDVRSYDCC